MALAANVVGFISSYLLFVFFGGVILLCCNKTKYHQKRVHHGGYASLSRFFFSFLWLMSGLSLGIGVGMVIYVFDTRTAAMYGGSLAAVVTISTIYLIVMWIQS